jgi:hypothetical protein
MSRHATRAARGPAEVTTIVVLAALLVVFTVGTPLTWLAVTHDPATTARTLIHAAAVVGGAADLIWMARSARGLLHLRGQS